MKNTHFQFLFMTMHLFTAPDYFLPTLTDQAVILFNLLPQRVLLPPDSQSKMWKNESPLAIPQCFLPFSPLFFLQPGSSLHPIAQLVTATIVVLLLNSALCDGNYLRAAILASMSLLSVSGVVSRWLSVPASESI